MSNIGQCRVCKQGLLEIVKEEKTNEIFICCDLCEGEWQTPEDAFNNQNGSRNKYGKVIYPTAKEIKSMHWNVKIFDDFN
ncbi:MAG: hypothetical protein IKV41_00575 [Oscillospiraceae bacterium]|nr:hypothetical protein [Oscillospiraceae bacterium]